MKKKSSLILLTCLFAVSVTANFMTSAYAGSEGSGGGSDVGMDFAVHAKLAIQELEQMGLASRYSISADELRKWLSESKIVVVSNMPIEGQSGFGQESIVVNHPTEKRIEVYGVSWDHIQDPVRKKSIALHELLSMAGREKTGDYTYSSEYESIARSPSFQEKVVEVCQLNLFAGFLSGRNVTLPEGYSEYVAGKGWFKMYVEGPHFLKNGDLRLKGRTQVLGTRFHDRSSIRVPCGSKTVVSFFALGSTALSYRVGIQGDISSDVRHEAPFDEAGRDAGYVWLTTKKRHL